MSRLMAYMCNDESLAAEVIQQIAGDLSFPATSSSSGFGFGWIQDGRSLLRTNPKPSAGSPEFLSLMADLPSRSVVAHLREPDEAAVGALDLQPFRFRRWVFAHLGETPEVADVRAQLLAGVPEFVRTNVKGASGEEVLGHLFLGELHRRDLLEKGRTNPRGCAEALRDTMNRIQVDAAIGDFAAVAVTERGLVAGCLGRPLFIRVVRGISAAKEQPLFAGHRPRSVNHPTFKAVIVTDSVAENDGGNWTQLPDRNVLFVDREWNLEFLTAD